MADSYFGLSERMRFVKEFHLSLKEITALSEYSDLNRVSADLVTALGKLPWYHRPCSLSPTTTTTIISL